MNTPRPLNPTQANINRILRTSRTISTGSLQGLKATGYGIVEWDRPLGARLADQEQRDLMVATAREALAERGLRLTSNIDHYNRTMFRVEPI